MYLNDILANIFDLTVLTIDSQAIKIKNEKKKIRPFGLFICIRRYLFYFLCYFGCCFLPFAVVYRRDKEP